MPTVKYGSILSLSKQRRKFSKSQTQAKPLLFSMFFKVWESTKKIFPLHQCDISGSFRVINYPKTQYILLLRQKPNTVIKRREIRFQWVKGCYKRKLFLNSANLQKYISYRQRTRSSPTSLEDVIFCRLLAYVSRFLRQEIRWTLSITNVGISFNRLEFWSWQV
jgi:hypothetical protein